MKLDKNDEYHSITFKQRDFSGQEFANKEFDSCTFIECNLSDVNFKRCNFVDCEFIKCNLSMATLGYSKFTDVSFRESKLIGIDWTKADWPNYLFHSPVFFEQSILNDCSFFGLNLPELVIRDCKAHNTDMREGDFNHADFTYTDLSYSLFGNTNLSEADFSEASHYDIDIHSNTLKGATFSRFEAVRLLESLDIKLLD